MGKTAKATTNIEKPSFNQELNLISLPITGSFYIGQGCSSPNYQ